MGLQPSTDEGGDGGDCDDGAASTLGGHLTGGSLAGVECAVEVYADGGGEEVVVEAWGKLVFCCL